jgi:hypothetical protein
MNTPRMYPRTLREAFKDADYGCAIERPEPLSRKLRRAKENLEDAAVYVVGSVGALVAFYVMVFA